MPLQDAITAIVIGNLVLMALAAVASYLSFKQAKTFSLLMQQTFGERATIPLALFVALVIIGWFSIQSSLFAHFIAARLHLSSIVESALGAALSLIFAAAAYFGIDALRRLSIFAVPALGLLCIWTWMAVPISDEPLALTHNLSLMGAITIVIGTWIVGATTTVGDILRFAKTSTVAVFGAIAGMGADLILMSVGAAAVQRYGNADLAVVLANAIGFIPGVVFFALDVGTTNENAMYSAGLNISVATKLRHRYAVAAATAIAATVALCQPYRYEIISNWLQFLGKAIPPIAAVVFVTAVFSPTLGRSNRYQRTRLWLSIASLLCGIFVAFIINAGIRPLNGFVTAAATQGLLLYIFEIRKRKLLIEFES